MDLIYNNSRDKNVKVTASKAILKGLCDDGGLFVPERIPELSKSLKELAELDYRELAYEVMKEFITDFTEEELKKCIASAYDEKFDTAEIAPLTYAGGAYYLELFHGKTIAFKDMALSILPHLMITAARKNDIKDEIVILTATSGDTGKAALAGFADVEGTRIAVFYPKDGVSPVQKLQMVTEKGKNTFVVGVDGNFDDCQSAVKKMFTDDDFNKKINDRGFRFSSANSINIGRLVPQIVYYVYAYTRLLANDEISEGDKVNVVVPTGNFGNILAAFYAKNMGLPINKLICASNENKVLFDFFKDGIHDRRRDFILTSSPSMDILISSNLERLIYHISGNDPDATRSFMEKLADTGVYEISDEMRKNLSDFAGFYADEKDTAEKIRSLYEDTGYIIDTHTAVAGSAYDKYLKSTGDTTAAVIASTASPFKFAKSVMTAIDDKYKDKDDFELIDELSAKGNIEIPDAINDIRNADIRHNTICKVEEMPAVVENFLK